MTNKGITNHSVEKNALTNVLQSLGTSRLDV